MSDDRSPTEPPVVGDAKAKAKWLLDAMSIDVSSIGGEDFGKNREKLAAKMALDRKGQSETDYREDRAHRILTGMEKATHANQRARMPDQPPPKPGEPAKGDGPPLAHALSAHGPGTDQMERLLSGRRADQVADEKQRHGQAIADLQKKQDALTGISLGKDEKEARRSAIESTDVSNAN